MHPRRPTILRLAALGGTALALVAWPQSGAAAASPPALAKAVRNTDTVRTLVYHSDTTESGNGLTIHVTNIGQEDEVHNRERDGEDVTVHTKQNGKTRTIHYTLDLIFMNGRTYYRTTLAHNNQWQTHSGMSLCDPIRNCWQRGRTTLTNLLPLAFSPVAGSATHFRAAVKQKTTHGTIDAWISSGKTPYVTRVLQNEVITTSGVSVKNHVDTTYGPFNSALVIQAPSGTA
jgi:hypothetical protein